jgi:putative transposase
MESGSNQGVRKASHCAWQIHYHIVFPVKYRKALLDDEVERIIVETAQAISERYDIEFEQIGCDGNHIHLLCSSHPKLAPGQIVRVFKSLTAKEIFRRKPEVKRALWGGQFWTDGYYVATVGEGGGWKVVEKYVRNQGQPRESLRQLCLF